MHCWTAIMVEKGNTFLIIAIFGAVIGICNSELSVVHVLFRHGDRTTELEAMYPKDPHKNVTYYPFGFGELTNKGKMRMYNVGKWLRLRYNEFLGNVYIPDLLESRSSEMRRTKMSLELVHAGLFPPKNTVENWNPELNWQPIPFNFEPINTDKILAAHKIEICPNVAKYLNELIKTEKVVEMTSKYNDTFNYMSEHTGWKIRNITAALSIWTTLKTEVEWGLELPEWAKRIYPALLDEMALTNFYLLSATKELKQISSGALLQKIVEDTEMKMNGTKDAKLYLYSGHDSNVVAFLQSLGTFEPHNPPYGACVLLEVHKTDGKYFVKVFYENYEKIQAGYRQIPGCEMECPWEKFVPLVQQYFLTDEVCGKIVREC